MLKRSGMSSACESRPARRWWVRGCRSACPLRCGAEHRQSTWWSARSRRQSVEDIDAWALLPQLRRNEVLKSVEAQKSSADNVISQAAQVGLVNPTLRGPASKRSEQAAD